MAKRDTSAARAAAAARRAGLAPAVPSATDGRPFSKSSSPTSRSSKSMSPGLLIGLGVAVAGAVAWGLARLSPAARMAGLEPWTGGGVWPVRRGQFIDPAAAASLVDIGKQLSRQYNPAGVCNSLPMTLDVSLETGGAYKRHLSHRTGKDIDIRAPKSPDSCFAALLSALMSAGWEVWYGGPGADQIKPTHRDTVHITHAHARFP